MLSTYCQECGSKNEYTLQRPKFCGNCGSPLSSDVKKGLHEKKKAPPKRYQARARESEIDEEGTDIFEVPNVSNFEYEIEYDKPTNRTLGSLLPESPTKPPVGKKRGRPQKTTRANAKKKKSYG